MTVEQTRTGVAVGVATFAVRYIVAFVNGGPVYSGIAGHSSGQYLTVMGSARTTTGRRSG